MVGNWDRTETVGPRSLAGRTNLRFETVKDRHDKHVQELERVGDKGVEILPVRNLVK